MEKKAIKEEDGVHKQWYIDAKDVTAETLPEFIRHLTKDYAHDYGTICHAVAAAGIAAMCAVDHDKEQGGITGFQAGAIAWEVWQNWLGEKGPMRMVKYEDMLYPQYEDKFAKTISSSTWQFLQQEAKKKLNDEGRPNPDILKHWKAIAEGTVPFGYVVENI